MAKLEDRLGMSKPNPDKVTFPDSMQSDELKHMNFIDMFSNFFENGVMISTYKPVFLRSLLDIGKYENKELVGRQWIHLENDKIRLDLDFIAVRFAKYYWDMEITFQLRHIRPGMADSNDLKQDVLITRLVRSTVAEIKKQVLMCGIAEDPSKLEDYKWMRTEYTKIESSPPSLAKLASDEMKEFRLAVIDKTIKPEVLRNMLNDMPALYERVHGKNYIVLDRSLIYFMKVFSPWLRKALNYLIASHLEKHNPSAMHIATMIDNERTFESRLAQVKKLEAQIVSGRKDDIENPLITESNT